ncbi:hypothetical protein BDV40DRAFT_265214 [Aspergillus tamarii]|uniref:Uncharacterized protein n=1 Tax=Aspergillus tamarii TaxID=41984 RepID=A0A5N6UV22_ASPTM|nr:hypothetical protein BDV40DRAFT_265214 [Aspergillus tamarii]
MTISRRMVRLLCMNAALFFINLLVVRSAIVLLTWILLEMKPSYWTVNKVIVSSCSRNWIPQARSR